MNSNFKKVVEFMHSFGQEVKAQPEFPDTDTVLLRLNLIREEVLEVIEATMNNDLTETAKELTDLLYVVYGAGAAFGIDLDACFEEVHDSNMSKLGADGKPMYREDGKVMKGPNYRPANLGSVIYPGH